MRTETKGFLASLALLAACVLVFALWGCAPQERRSVPAGGPRPPLLVWLGTTGPSMLPKYPEAGLIEIDISYPYEKLKVGDEVVFWNYTKSGGHKFLFHPIVAKQGEYFITQGLNPVTNPRADDSWLTPDTYVGKATGRHTIILTAPNHDP